MTAEAVDPEVWQMLAAGYAVPVSVWLPADSPPPPAAEDHQEGPQLKK
jgi:hypothetical protein